MKPLAPCAALIAEDEPLLRQGLVQSLRQAWPELDICAQAGDGLSAVQLALQHLPQVIFLDVRMPGLNGLDAAAEIMQAWPADRALPLLVFATAFDEYAVAAFEQAAMDYLVKPVSQERLARCVVRLQQFLKDFEPESRIKNALSATDSIANENTASAEYAQTAAFAQLFQQLQAGAAQHTPKLKQLQVAVGQSILIVPIGDVLAFDAADKYVRVLLQGHEYLIRTPLKDLLPQLDAQEFWQIHRSTLVRASAVHSAQRDDAGRLHLRLHGLNENFAVSRLWAHRFKPM